MKLSEQEKLIREVITASASAYYKYADEKVQRTKLDKMLSYVVVMVKEGTISKEDGYRIGVVINALDHIYCAYRDSKFKITNHLSYVTSRVCGADTLTPWDRERILVYYSYLILTGVYNGC